MSSSPHITSGSVQLTQDLQPKDSQETRLSPAPPKGEQSNHSIYGNKQRPTWAAKKQNAGDVHTPSTEHDDTASATQGSSPPPHIVLLKNAEDQKKYVDSLKALRSIYDACNEKRPLKPEEWKTAYSHQETLTALNKQCRLNPNEQARADLDPHIQSIETELQRIYSAVQINRALNPSLRSPILAGRA